MKSSTVKGLVAGTIVGASVLAALPASAADLGGRPVRPPRDFAPAYAPPLEVARWSGFYVGGTMGYNWGTSLASGDVGQFSFDQTGWAGTIHAGYNWQLGRAVLGLEADIGTGSYGGRTGTAFGTLESEMNAIGSLRARAGILMTPSLLLYGTAGLAMASMDFGFQGGSQTRETLTGYQVGAGTEFLMTNNVSLRFEYIYTDLGKTTFQHSGQNNAYDTDFHQVRAGLSFKF